MRPLVRHQGRVRLYEGDSREVLKLLPDNSLDSCSCDPPYALVSVIERFGGDDAAPAKFGTDGLYARASAGFMGQKWDTGETAFAVEFWREVLRVLKHGAHLAAFGGTRTYHHLAMAIELAGFEIRDQLAWMYGTGFPKSHPQPDGSGTALKPAWEPIALARKPLSEKTVAANLARWGTGSIWVEQCRIPGTENTARAQGKSIRGGQWSGDGGKSDLVTGGGTDRFPANVLHDGSEEVLAAFPSATGAKADVEQRGPNHVYGKSNPGEGWVRRVDESTSAARFFYNAKASKADREEGLEHFPLAEGKTRRNIHPTVKPTPVMAWLTRLITPPGGVVLDPFMGSGSTGKACMQEGFEFIGIDAQPEFIPIAEARIAFAAAKYLPAPKPEPTKTLWWHPESDSYHWAGPNYRADPYESDVTGDPEHEAEAEKYLQGELDYDGY